MQEINYFGLRQVLTTFGGSVTSVMIVMNLIFRNISRIILKKKLIKILEEKDDKIPESIKDRVSFRDINSVCNKVVKMDHQLYDLLAQMNQHNTQMDQYKTKQE